MGKKFHSGEFFNQNGILVSVERSSQALKCRSEKFSDLALIENQLQSCVFVVVRMDFAFQRNVDDVGIAIDAVDDDDIRHCQIKYIDAHTFSSG